MFLSSWSLLIGLIVVVAAAIASWVFSPKGENQTYVLLFSSSFLFCFVFSMCGWVAGWVDRYVISYLSISVWPDGWAEDRWW